MTGRWVRGRFGYSWPQCRFCGRAQDHDCPPVDCLACGTRQCHGYGSANGRCALCFYGYLPGWGRNYEGLCGYKGCSNEPVAEAPRVGRVCREHLARPTFRWGGTTTTLAERIAARIAQRDSGRGEQWDRWRWVS